MQHSHGPVQLLSFGVGRRTTGHSFYMARFHQAVLRLATLIPFTLSCTMLHSLPPQVRVPVADVAAVVRQLVDSQLSWQEVAAKYPQQKAAEDEQQ